MQKITAFECFAALITLFVVVAVFLWNVNIQLQFRTDFDTYRSLVHNCIELALEANEMMNETSALRKLADSRIMLETASKLVGGLNVLTKMSGLDTNQILNYIVERASQIRALLQDENNNTESVSLSSS